MSQSVQISFDCLPLRTVGRLDIPIDASPVYQARCERIKQAISTHGSHNAFYLYNAQCAFHLTNDPQVGMLQFGFEGTVLTDETDEHTVHAYLDVKVQRETCDWLTQPVVDWFLGTVRRAVMVEFDRYITAGDLQATIERRRKLQAATDEHGGYMGMFL